VFKRPTSRRKSAKSEVTLNLVPILDTMVTLIGFLLFTMSFLALVSIESPFPQATPESVQEKLKERPLQLTLTLREDEAEIWSPFEKVPARKIPNSSDRVPDIRAIHEHLVAIKQQFPNEASIVLVPYSGATYDVLISIMDTIRMVEASDTPIYAKNAATGNDEVVKLLFPNVIFGNLLGDS
jgi:biopolymer transport protein ExbD